MKEFGTNKIQLQGMLLDKFTFSHEITLQNNNEYIMDLDYKEIFYENRLSIKTGDKEDVINLLFNKKLISNLKKGNRVNINGQIRTTNKVVNGKNKLLVYVYVLDVKYTEEKTYLNIAELEGYLCCEKNYWNTPKTGASCNTKLRVYRYYEKADYIPIVLWGVNATTCNKFELNTKIKVSGRFISRQYKKDLGNGNLETNTSYELFVSSMQKLS
ncbi:single-stranded DNA-binding protein [Clostridioides difficile]|uniref:single-stranded DNA-binding protein n=1 Tax=Clostridioides difficile TaxID=1496 RepID=UPI000D1FBB65|nr:single-stranded DNA-binding protein [Clostridioides difficile]HBE9444572.1 single-stranded DNA-binding protein [Clostridioides difficile]